MSTHKALVYKLEMRPHPDAQALSIQDVGDGNVVVLRTQDWTQGQLAVHIEPDYEVDTNDPRFSWLKDPTRPDRQWVKVKPAKLRGVVSWGLMAPIDGCNPGDDALPLLNQVVRRWEPPAPMSPGGQAIAGPALVSPKYDVESYFKNTHWFTPGEEVVACEKLHGANGRYTYHDGQFWCGSRTEWKRDELGNIWWRALRNSQGLQDFLKANPNLLVYGEVYGMNPGFEYGCDKPKGEIGFAAFDLMLQDKAGHHAPFFMDWDVVQEIRNKNPNLPWVPIVYQGPWELDTLKALATGNTLMPGTGLREGIVVRPVRERRTDKLERVQVKFVSDDYLNKA